MQKLYTGCHMKKLLGIMLIALSAVVIGCGEPTGEAEESTVETHTQKETEHQFVTVAEETVGSWVSFTYGEVSKYEPVSGVFTTDDVESVYEDRLLKKKNSYATAEVKCINDDTIEHNHSVFYSSAAGSVSNIKISHDTGNNLIPSAAFSEADMNGDGYKDLIVKFISAAGTGYSEGMYIYDFKNKKGTEIYGLTKKQKDAVLKEFQKWYVNGFTEIMEINHGLVNELNCSSFHPEAVMYNGKMALYVTFAPPFPCSWADYGTGYSAMLVYKDGEYVVDNVWVSGQYRTDVKESIYGVQIGTSHAMEKY